MLITIFLYLIAIAILFYRSFYNSFQHFSVNNYTFSEKINILNNFICFNSIYLFFNFKKINTFSFIINFSILLLFNFFILFDYLNINQIAYCMENVEIQSDTASSTDSNRSSYNGTPTQSPLSPPLIDIFIDQEFDRFFSKKLPYMNYVGDCNKCFSTDFCGKIFVELNKEIDYSKIILNQIDRKLCTSTNPEILDITIENYQNILTKLNFNLYKIKFIFIKTYLDVFKYQTGEFDGNLKTSLKILYKIPFINQQSNNGLILPKILEYMFNPDTCFFLKNNINFIKYLNLVISTNNEILANLPNNGDAVVPLNLIKERPIDVSIPLFIEIPVNNASMHQYFDESSRILSEGDNDTYINMMDGETNIIFERKADSLEFFKEHRRFYNDLETHMDTTLLDRNNLTFIRDSVFFKNNYLKCYSIGENAQPRIVLDDFSTQFQIKYPQFNEQIRDEIDKDRDKGKIFKRRIKPLEERPSKIRRSIRIKNLEKLKK